MIGKVNWKRLGDKLQTTLVDLIRCREREARYRHRVPDQPCWAVATR